MTTLPPEQLNELTMLVQQLLDQNTTTAPPPGTSAPPGPDFPSGYFTPAPSSYQCMESWANCPAGRPNCYWGEQSFNRGKCCTTPTSNSCVPAPTRRPARPPARPPAPMSSAPPTAAPYLPLPIPDSDNENDDTTKTRKPKKTKKPSGGAGGGGSWKKATATWYTSYPECCHNKSVDQSECDDYSGCKYEGMFAAFDGKKSKEWVQANNIVAFYASPNSQNRKEWAKRWKNKKLRLRNPKTGKTLDVTVVDTCDDKDCSGCCSKNANKNGGFLIDLERNTAERFYGGKVEDLTSIEWQEI